ncbi:hypothetical protein ACFL27_24415 [candidate division CSSED10-310 bacterium]|uniref:Transposase IS200-like domain-containing protein n=1 Tax=candidate division CSSED10-310 bacterium TaxID=2855610 RepID=A0ABV6Z4I8_UNCC1
MGWQARIQFPGAIYHVFVRGYERRDIYEDRDDYYLFIEALVKFFEFAQYEVWCYALLDNPPGFCNSIRKL